MKARMTNAGPISIHNREEWNKRVGYEAAMSVGSPNLYLNHQAWQNAIYGAQSESQRSANKGYLKHIGATSRYNSKTPQGSREMERRKRQIDRGMIQAG